MSEEKPNQAKVNAVLDTLLKHAPRAFLARVLEDYLDEDKWDEVYPNLIEALQHALTALSIDIDIKHGNVRIWLIDDSSSKAEPIRTEYTLDAILSSAFQQHGGSAKTSKVLAKWAKIFADAEEEALTPRRKKKKDEDGQPTEPTVNGASGRNGPGRRAS